MSFLLGRSNVQDDIDGFDENVSGHFVDMLDDLRRIVKYTNGIPTVVDAHGNNVDGIRIQTVYQGLDARTEIVGRTRRLDNLLM